MVREDNKKEVERIKEKLESYSTIIITDYRGLTVSSIKELRSKLKEKDIEYKVIKNTLCKIALSDMKLSDVDEIFVGPTAIAFSNDPVVPSKILIDFSKNNEALKIKGGIFEKAIVSVEDVKTFSKLPPKEVLIANVIGGIKAPLTGLVNVLSGPMRGLVYALNQIKEKKT
jgi:large subunit ribosomal protein L10